MSDEGIEIERKFVLLCAPADAYLESLGAPVQIDQRYLMPGPDGLERRVRKSTTDGEVTYVYNEKGAPPTPTAGTTAVVRREHEEEVNAERYEELLTEADPSARTILKVRWKIPRGGLVFELDHVSEPVDFWVVEVELASEDVSVTVPDEFGPVIEDPACSMARIARGTYQPPV